MGNSGAQALGLEQAEVPVANSVAGMIKVVRYERIVFAHVLVQAN